MKSNISKSFESKSVLRAYSEGGFVQSLRNAMGMGNNPQRRSRIDQAVDQATSAPKQPAPPPPPPPPPPEDRKIHFSAGGFVGRGLNKAFSKNDKELLIDTVVGGGLGIGAAALLTSSDDDDDEKRKKKKKKGEAYADGGYVVDDEDVGVVAPGLQNGGPLRGMVNDRINMAGGGRVTGKGGPREDKVGPLMLSAGEYVLPAKTVQHLGGPDQIDDLVQATNDGREPGARTVKGGKIGAADGTAVDRLRGLGERIGYGATNAMNKGVEYTRNAANAVSDINFRELSAADMAKKAQDAATAASERVRAAAGEAVRPMVDSVRNAATAASERVRAAAGEAVRPMADSVRNAAGTAREFLAQPASKLGGQVGSATARGADALRSLGQGVSEFASGVRAGYEGPANSPAQAGAQAARVNPSMVGPAENIDRTATQAERLARGQARAAADPLTKAGGFGGGTPPTPPTATATAAGAPKGSLIGRGVSAVGRAIAPVAAVAGGWEAGQMAGNKLYDLMSINETDDMGASINGALRMIGLGVDDSAYRKYRAQRGGAEMVKDSVTNGELPAPTAAVATPGAATAPTAARPTAPTATPGATAAAPGTADDTTFNRLRQLGMELRPDLGDANNTVAKMGNNAYVGFGNGKPMEPTGVRFASDADIARLRNMSKEDIERGYKKPMQVSQYNGGDGKFFGQEALERSRAEGEQRDQLREMTRFRPSVGAGIMAQERSNIRDNATRAADSALRAQGVQDSIQAQMRGQDLVAQSNALNNETQRIGQIFAAKTAGDRMKFDVANTMRQQANSDREYQLNVQKFGIETANKLRDDNFRMSDAATKRLNEFTQGRFINPETGKPDAERGQRFQQAAMSVMDKKFLEADPATQARIMANAATNFQILEAFNENGGVWSKTIDTLPGEMKVRAAEIADWTKGASLSDIMKSKVQEILGIGSPGMVVDPVSGEVRGRAGAAGGNADRLRQMQ